MSEYIVKCKELVGISGITMQLPEYIDTNQEIVRCRDCAYYDKYPNDEISVCYRFDNEQPIVEPDGFCAWGERRGA